MSVKIVQTKENPKVSIVIPSRNGNRQKKNIRYAI